MDLAETVAPKSDQLNADDLMTGPRTFTITEVTKGSDEQPVDVHLAEFPSGRPWRPSKSMRRVLLMAWGRESSAYIGRRLTLYRDPEITFGPDKVGGVRISHMSHLDKRMVLALTVKRGSRKPYTVEPLADDTAPSPAVSDDTLVELNDLFLEADIPEDQRLAGVNAITGGSATALEVITEDEAQRVLASLRKKVGR